MTALLNLHSMVRLLALSVCTITYVKPMLPKQIASNISVKENTHGFTRVVYTASVIGERLSPFISLLCLYYAAESLFGVFS